MITWPIAAARKSGLFDRIVVSTEDAEIAAVAEAAGAEVPFLREATLAGDHAGVTEVVQDAIGRLSRSDEPPQLVCLIYATAALLRADDLFEGLDRLRRNGTDFAISVTPFPAPVERALVVEGGRVRMMKEENLLVRSQDLVAAFHDAGQFCWGRAEAWMSGQRVFVAPTAAVRLPSYRVQDVDTIEDWARAEMIARLLGVGTAA